jgi:hypothetical protein
MSGWAAISLAVLTLGSCWASYCMGQRDILIRLRKMREKEDRWREWDANNLEDFED